MNSTRQFEWQGKTITIKQPRNRDRDHLRKLLRKIADIDVDTRTKEEFASAVCYTLSGDEDVWNRPSPDAPLAVIVAALNEWLDEVDTLYTDTFVVETYTRTPAAQSPVKPETDDPNSSAPEPSSSKNS